MTERVIVVVPNQGGEVIGVFEDEESYDSWLENSKWNRDQITVRDCRVR